MEQVAAEASMSRQTVYRYVSGRDELVALALLDRCREFSEALRPTDAVPPGKLKERIVELIVASVRIGRDDEEFRSLTEALPTSMLVPLETSPESPMHELVGYAFGPLLESGRKSGVLRSDASDGDIVEWIQGVVAVFASRPDLDETAQRRRIRLFVLPALFG